MNKNGTNERQHIAPAAAAAVFAAGLNKCRALDDTYNQLHH